MQLAAAWWEKFLLGLTPQLVLPAIMLAVILAAVVWMFWRAQKREDFDFAEMLRGDQNGKVSPWKTFAFGAFAFSSWGLMTEVMNARLTDWFWWGYQVTWAGTPSLMIAVSRWNGVLPFSKGEALAPSPISKE